MLEKTRLVSEAILMHKMSETNKPYFNPEQLSKGVEKSVRAEKEDTTDLRATLTK